jgi:hypothetical protein
MTDPIGSTPAVGAARWYLRPRIALALVALFIVIVAVLTPEAIDGRSGDGRLTTHSTSPNGASIIYELARRLGWRVERRNQSGVPADPRTIHVVLDPPRPPSAIETHAVLEHVRRGGALLYVLSATGPLNDSLRVRRGEGSSAVLYPDAERRSAPDTARTAADSRRRDSQSDDDEAAGDPHGCDRGSNGAAPMWPDGQMRLWALRWRGTSPARLVVFAESQLVADSADLGVQANPAAVGFNYGDGRIVVIADPDLLRNDVLRVCAWDADATTVRMLEYLSERAPDGRRRRDRLVFDEYHQGYGSHASLMKAVKAFLVGTAPGHAVAQIVLAGLILVVALAPRGIPPHDAERVQRRSPLEHVNALARAYMKTGATRTAVGLLLRGLRRRVEHRATRGRVARDASTFLDWALGRVPDQASDVAAIRRALVTPVSRRELDTVGGALRRLESALEARRG